MYSICRTFNITLLVLSFFFSSVAFTQEIKKERMVSDLKWEGGVDFDFGKVPQDKIVTHVFSFINTGDTAVLLKGTEASCRCTIADFSREPVQKGERGFIRVSFDPSHYSREFYKTIFLFTDISKERIELHISGEVIKE